jgi:hypothetical protein
VYSRWEEVSGRVWIIFWQPSRPLRTTKGLTITPGARGDNGPLNVLQTPTVSQITSNVLLPASQAAFPGIPTVVDYNDPSVENCLDLRAQWFVDPNINIAFEHFDLS